MTWFAFIFFLSFIVMLIVISRDEKIAAYDRHKVPLKRRFFDSFGAFCSLLAGGAVLGGVLFSALYGLSHLFGDEGNAIVFGVALLVVYAAGMFCLFYGKGKGDTDEPHVAYFGTVGLYLACLLTACVLFGWFFKYATSGDGFLFYDDQWANEAFKLARDALLPIGEPFEVFLPLASEVRPGWPEVIVYTYSFLIQLSVAALFVSVTRYFLHNKTEITEQA